MASILVIEDEAAIRRGLCDLLAFRGHQPSSAERGDQGLERALGQPWDLLLVDVMLPGVDGFTICEQVRQARPGQAILLLTAKGEEADILRGFEAGCDDYITKPFSIAQLSARVDALLRRASPAPRALDLGVLRVEVDTLEAHGPEGTTELSTRDVQVLEFLYQERHRVVPREDLLRQVWGYARPEALETRCVDMHLVKLRRKLDRVAPGQQLISTVRGAGYRMRLE